MQCNILILKKYIYIYFSFLTLGNIIAIQRLYSKLYQNLALGKTIHDKIEAFLKQVVFELTMNTDSVANYEPYE